MVFVRQLVGWFIFINSAMVIFLLPLAFFRFFWWRFNVWGELAAIILGLPLSILVWFVFDYQNQAKHPMWEGLSLLFGLSIAILLLVTFLTPAESRETLENFHQRCRPPGLWGNIGTKPLDGADAEPSLGELILNSLLGIFACLGLALSTNALFVRDWFRFVGGIGVAGLLTAWLVFRMFKSDPAPAPSAEDCPQPESAKV
jgi:hypothetical protein